MDPILATRGFFLAGIGAGILFDQVPYFKTRYVDYGSRSSISATEPTNRKKSSASALLELPDKAFAYPVPHSWFLHYYILSVSLSLFWGYQLFFRGNDVQDSMDVDRVYLAWSLLLIQGSRRLYESIYITKSSSSTMPLAIYLIGMAYYVFDSIGIWIEGSATIMNAQPLSWTEIITRARFGCTPSLRVLVVMPVFILASGTQNDCHRYLASLKKYTLPAHPVFADIICPHYLMECLIYLALTIIAAPRGQMINKTIFTTFVFTTINLGLVAKGAKEWSLKKFGKEEVENRWRMIPYIW